MQSTPIPLCFFTILLLIVVIPSASADQLFITNLMQYPEPMVLEDSAIHAETIRSLEQQIKDEPQRTWQLRSEIATTKARQGKLTEALNDLSLLLANTKGNSSELALEERAELKSIMGFTDAALDDNSKVLLADQNWLFLWHRWLILKRGGQIKDAQETLGQALQALQRHGADNNLAKALVATGKKENCVPDNSAQIITDKALTQLKQTAQLSTPPSNKDMAIIFGLKLVDSNNGTSTFKSEKISCLWTSASAADNFNQLKLDVFPLKPLTKCD